jgi:hypothetical protein
VIVIPGITITDALLTSSTSAEPGAGETAWNAATNYATGDVVIRTGTHRKYERLAPGGVDATAPELAEDKWLDIGPTNKWAMFDLERNSQTVIAAGALVVEIAPGQRVDAIGLVGLQGASARVQMHIGATMVYDSGVISLSLRYTTTWSQYFFGAFRRRDSLLLTGLPLSTGAKVTVTIQPVDGEARCGGLVLGRAEAVGTIIDEPVSDVLNFSKTERDSLGNLTLRPVPNVPVLQHRLYAPTAHLDRLRDLRERLNAVPALFSGVDANVQSHFFDTLLALAIVKRFSISMRAQRVLIELNLEAL